MREQAVDGSCVPAPHQRIIERRSNRLARGLHRRGLGAGSHMVVYNELVQGIDALVALRAAEKLRARVSCVRVPSEDAQAVEAARWLASHNADVILACHRGVRSLRAANVPGLIIGDGPGVLWSRLVEASESDADFSLDASQLAQAPARGCVNPDAVGRR